MNGTWEAGDRLPLFEGLVAEEPEPGIDTSGCGVSFSRALDHLKTGGSARRAKWGDGAGAVCVAAGDRDPSAGLELDSFLVYVEGGRAVVWWPCAADLFCDDWLLADAIPAG